MIGEKILGYTVDEKIGSGRFGTVYKVSKTNASGTYIRALKHIIIPSRKQYSDVLNSMGGDYDKTDEYFAEVFKEIVNEIQIISALSEAGAQNIVRYYENDIVESNSPKRYDIYILMEYLTPFTDYVFQNEITVKDIIKLGKDILTALISCHSHDIIHRDIKDDNIFVSADGSYKLGDFGVSKMLKDHTIAESLKGTPNFIAPEVYLGKEQYDDTVDVYSLGIVLYKLLNRSRSPFLPFYPQSYSSTDENRAFSKRMKGEVPPLPIDAQNELGQVILKAIAKKEERFESAKEFLKQLEEVESRISKIETERVVHKAIFPRTPAQDKDRTISTSIGTENFTIQTDMERDNTLFLTISDFKSEVQKSLKDFQTQKEDSIKEEKRPKSALKKKIGIGIGVLILVISIPFFVISNWNNIKRNREEKNKITISPKPTITQKILSTPTATSIVTPTPTIVTPTCTLTPTPTPIKERKKTQENINSIPQDNPVVPENIVAPQSQNNYQPPAESQNQQPQEQENNPYEGLDDFIIVE